LCEAAAVGSETGGEAGGFVLIALREEALVAVEAFATGDVMEAHDAIAELEFFHAPPHGNDGTGEFVTANLRRLDIALKDFLDVGAADAAGSDFDEHFTIADVRNRHFLDANDSPFAIDTGLHGAWNRAERADGFDHSASAAHREATCSKF